MIVIKDCTGTYLRFDGKDYFVCNYHKLDSFEDGKTVTVTFRNKNGCSQKEIGDRFFCMEPHNYPLGDCVEVEKIQ